MGPLKILAVIFVYPEYDLKLSSNLITSSFGQVRSTSKTFIKIYYYYDHKDLDYYGAIVNKCTSAPKDITTWWGQ